MNVTGPRSLSVTPICDVNHSLNVQQSVKSKHITRNKEVDSIARPNPTTPHAATWRRAGHSLTTELSTRKFISSSKRQAVLRERA